MVETGHHRLWVSAQRGALRLEVGLEFTASWTLVFGPSGSGKSSLLRAICGLLETGEVGWEARSAGGAWFPAARRTRARATGFAPQQPTLFPHLNVRDNVAFGATSHGMPAGANVSIDAALAMFDLEAMAGRMPRELSGGEQQRVNLARAFAVPDVSLMLLDEPFSGVDRTMRDALLPRMQAWLVERKVPVISVSHDVDEALLLGAEVVRLEEGRVVAQGPAAEVLAEERARMVRLLG